MMLRCPHCARVWDEHFDLPMNLAAFAARLEACSICVKCGWKGVVWFIPPGAQKDVEP